MFCLLPSIAQLNSVNSLLRHNLSGFAVHNPHDLYAFVVDLVVDRLHNIVITNRLIGRKNLFDISKWRKKQAFFIQKLIGSLSSNTNIRSHMQRHRMTYSIDEWNRCTQFNYVSLRIIDQMVFEN